MADSRESSCTTESSLAEQEFNEIQEQQQRDKAFNTLNITHSAAVTSMRMESNTRLAQFTVPPTPPTSRTDAMKLLEQLQAVSTSLIDIGKAEIDLAAKFMYNLRLSRHLRNRLESIGVTSDTHGLVYANQDEMIRAITRVGCNRAHRIFLRQSITRNKAKAAVNQRIENIINTDKEKKTPGRKPRAKKVAEAGIPTMEEPVLTQFNKTK